VASGLSCAAFRNLHSSPTRRSSDLYQARIRCSYSHRLARSPALPQARAAMNFRARLTLAFLTIAALPLLILGYGVRREMTSRLEDRKSTRLNSSHVKISYAVFCLKK